MANIKFRTIKFVLFGAVAAVTSVGLVCLLIFASAWAAKTAGLTRDQWSLFLAFSLLAAGGAGAGFILAKGTQS
jgi:hypothetical protein